MIHSSLSKLSCYLAKYYGWTCTHTDLSFVTINFSWKKVTTPKSVYVHGLKKISHFGSHFFSSNKNFRSFVTFFIYKTYTYQSGLRGHITTNIVQQILTKFKKIWYVQDALIRSRIEETS